MDQLTYAYLAGIIDGEGTICLLKRLDRPSLKPVVKVNMTDEEVVLFLHSSFGGTVRPRARAQAHHKDQWIWRVTHGDAARCVAAIRPYLIVKRQNADELLAYTAVPRKKGRPKKL